MSNDTEFSKVVSTNCSYLFEKLIFWVPIIFSVLFIATPILIIVFVSFCSPKYSSPPYETMFSIDDSELLVAKINFGNYLKVLRDDYYIESFINSITLSAIITILTVVVGFCSAYGLYSMKKKWKGIFSSLIYISFWTSLIVRIYSWMNLLGKNGIINNFLLKLHLIESPIQFLNNTTAVYIGMVFCYLPFVILPIHAYLESIDYIYIEAAYDLGYSPIRTFWKVILPLSKNSIISSCFFIFSMSIGEFAIPELLGGSNILTFGKILWNEFNIDWPRACAMSILIILLVMLPTYIVQKFLRNREYVQ